jgi:hypothetical protein
MTTDLFPIARPAHDPGGRSKPRWPPGSIVTAKFSGTDDCYRDELSEIWNPDLPLVMFLMMNPSVAGVAHSDPTLIRTGTFARSWGYGGQLIGNMHAYRATDCRRLMDVSDPVGPNNDAAILAMAARSDLVVLAYGQPPKPLRPRADRVIRMLADGGVRLTYLRLSQDGTPQHPLYLPGSLRPVNYTLADSGARLNGNARMLEVIANSRALREAS